MYQMARKTDRTVLSLDDVTAWIATRPASETFPTAAGCNCLFCQYGEAMGLGSAWDVPTYAKTIALEAAPGDHLSGDPSKWPDVRGIKAVIDAILDTVYVGEGL